MFKEINKELEELQQEIFRCRKIDTMLSSLKDQLEYLGEFAIKGLMDCS